MKIYYDKDASIKNVFGRKVSVIGYGSQGRAQALNLRDSGLDIRVGNIQDNYWDLAVNDGFEPVNIEQAATEASIILFLIPDQAQKHIYEKYIEPYLVQNDLLIFAHGFSINYRKINPPDHVDVCLLAPRMPGTPIRDHYLNGHGVPAFMDVHQNASGKAKGVLLGLAKAIGFTRVGVMEVTFQEETELDLFVEQFFLPMFIGIIQASFDVLVDEGYNPMPALMELYASGELGELMLLSSKIGIYKVWIEQASPTCRYGIFRNSKRLLDKEKMRSIIKTIIQEIRDGVFLQDLEKEAESGYRNLKTYDKRNDASLLMKTQRKLSKSLKTFKEDNPVC